MLATRAFLPTLVFLAAGAAVAPALADDACMDFKWDVSKERALFAGPTLPVAAGADVKSAPTVQLDHLYRLELVAQDKAAFAAAPGRKPKFDAAHAGIAVIQIPAAGSYRIALDAPVWIDLVANQLLLKAKDFQGQHGCSAPHKIVEFELAADQKIVLQLSDAEADSVEFTVTASPARKR